MPTYQIESQAGVILGQWSGETEQDAIDAMNAEVGTHEHCDDSELIVFEVEPPLLPCPTCR